jgi:hypothetical protein
VGACAAHFGGLVGSFHDCGQGNPRLSRNLGGAANKGGKPANRRSFRTRSGAALARRHGLRIQPTMTPLFVPHHTEIVFVDKALII